MRFPTPGLFTWYRQNDSESDCTFPTPTIVGNPQSEAIERLLRRVDTCIYKLGRFDSTWVVKPPSERQLRRQTARTFFLESCRHFLIAVQYLHAFLLQTQHCSKNSDNLGKDSVVQVALDKISQ
jgi:hypothetical protein